MVFVIDKNKKPLAPCHEARARKLLSHGKAKIFRMEPFTIILMRTVDEDVTPCVLKIDPGSQHTGIAIIQGDRVLWMGQIEHRRDIQKLLEKRSAYRRRRRSKNLRYRKVRFDNRKKPKGWFPPTIMSRLQNIVTIVKRLMKICPIEKIEYELVNFDTQLLQNPDIKGVEYQEGPLYRTEMRTYLLNTFQGVCQYCGGKSKDPKLEWEHIVPKSRGGSNSVSNATLSCHCCNADKDNMTLSEWANAIAAKKRKTALDKARITGIAGVQKKNYSTSLAAAAITNAIRWKIKDALIEATNLPVGTCPARQTKYNRVERNLSKEHCVDAVCVGYDLPKEFHFKTNDCLVIVANGRGSHCRTNVDKQGFPIGKYYPRKKDFFGFQTGNMVIANVPSGAKCGKHRGRVTCRSSGSFNIKTSAGLVQGINYKYMRPILLNDGYSYSHKSAL